MLEVLIKLKLYVYKNDRNNVNLIYLRLFPAQWMNGLQTVADPDLQIRWRPGLPDSEIKRGVEGAGSVSFGLKIRGGAGPSPGSGDDRKCSIHKIKLKLNGKLDACVKSKQTTRTNRLG